MKQTMKRMLAFLLVFGLAAATGSMSAMQASAAAAPEEASLTEEGNDAPYVRMVLDRPADTALKLYKGHVKGDDTLLSPEEDGSYILTEGGIYTASVSGTGYYSVNQLIYLSDEEFEAANAAADHIHRVNADPGKMTGEGYYQCNPASELQFNYEKIPLLLNDEMRDIGFGTDGLPSYPEGGYPIPVFDEDKGNHEWSSNEDVAELIGELAGDPAVYPLIAGYSEKYDFPIHLVIFSETADIPENATLEQAAEAILADGGKNQKPLIFIGAQVHGCEASTGDAALAYMTELCGEYGESLLDHVNVMVIPRYNPDGAYLGHRTASYLDEDMNRDLLMLQNHENAVAMNVFNLFRPHMQFDLHERDANEGELSDFGMAGMDIKISSSNLMANDLLEDYIHELRSKAIDGVIAEGLRGTIYGTSAGILERSGAPALGGAVAFLLETRGCGAGLDYLERRIHAQVMGLKSAIPSTEADAKELYAKVSDWRAERIRQGGIYDETDPIPLDADVSDNAKSFTYDEYTINWDGSEFSIPKPYRYADTISRSRTRPTAYLIDAAPAEAPGPEPDGVRHNTILQILDNHAVEYYKLPAGTTVNGLKQSCIVSKSDDAVNELGLRDAADVTFENGAYFIPMDQLKQTVVATLMEIDNPIFYTKDSSGRGSLYRAGYLAEDADGDLPIYHYTVNDPRALLEEIENEPAGYLASKNTGAADTQTLPVVLTALAAAVVIAVIAGCVVYRRRKTNR